MIGCRLEKELGKEDAIRRINLTIHLAEMRVNLLY